MVARDIRMVELCGRIQELCASGAQIVHHTNLDTFRDEKID
jgi:hypothetical protein